MTIDGASAGAGSALEVINPATGEAFATAPDGSREQVEQAMAAAQRAFPGWSGDESARRRSMRACADAIEAEAAAIARIHTLEQGKPLRESLGYVRGAAATFRAYADLEIPRQVVQDDGQAAIAVRRRPLGVVAVIRPWNGLLGDPTPAALRAGKTLVYKPSPHTPLASLAVGQVLASVLAPGVFNVVSGRDPLGQWIVEHPVPRGIAFTGSSEIGRRVNAAAAPDLKRVVLELGGNDAAVVLDDVDHEELARRLFWTAFGNCGQMCLGTKRVYLPESIFDRTANALAKIAAEVRVGDGLDPQTEMGPLTTEQQLDRVRELVDDALAQGATPLAGGNRVDRPGFFFAPTILTGVREGMRIVDEEQFGPALPLLSYRTVDEAIERANATPFGLGGSVWSQDPARATVLAERLESGSAWANTHAQSGQQAPFGGVKASGLGSQHGIWSITSFTDAQTMWCSRAGRTTYPAAR
jgi:acyl-CoA reductase-like NAD-dependent aldehyde dehydrogenase